MTASERVDCSARCAYCTCPPAGSDMLAGSVGVGCCLVVRGRRVVGESVCVQWGGRRSWTCRSGRGGAEGGGGGVGSVFQGRIDGGRQTGRIGRGSIRGESYFRHGWGIRVGPGVCVVVG